MIRRVSRTRFLGTAAALCAAAGLPHSAAAADEYTMRLGTPEAANSVLSLVGLRFAQNVRRRSNGQLKIEVYPLGQLATQLGTADGLVTGVVDFAVQATIYEQGFVPQLQALELPFLFRNINAGYKVIDGPVGEALTTALEAKGIYAFGFAGSFRQIWTNKVVTVPDDMKGVRVRISGGAVSAPTYQSLGAIPVTIDLSETYTALSQKTVDGIDINVDSFTTSKFYTLVKHEATSNHSLNFSLVLGSRRKIDALPPALQKIVKEEARAVVPYWRALTVKQSTDDIGFLKNNGVAFNDIQYPVFRKAVDPVYAMMQTRIGGEFLDQITKAASAA